MTKSEQAELVPISAEAEMSEESVLLVNTLDFPFAANAPQDFQDSQDKQRQAENPNRDHGLSDKDLLDLPLEDYVKIVIAFSEKLTEEQAIDTYDTWHSPLFNFARFCKALECPIFCAIG